jgi:hypothetical protein
MPTMVWSDDLMNSFVDPVPDELFGGQAPSRSGGRARVPDVVGETVAAAGSPLGREGFEVDRPGRGPAGAGDGTWSRSDRARGAKHRRSVPVVISVIHPPAV